MLDVTKLKAFADDKSNVAKMAIPLFDKVDNSALKGVSHSGFFFFRVLTSQDCVVKS